MIAWLSWASAPALIIGFSVRSEVGGFLALANERPRRVVGRCNLHLLMKLVGSSLASGLERMRSDSRGAARTRGTQ